MAYMNPNLLPANLSNFDGSATAWVAGANTAVTVSNSQYISSPYSMRLTPAAAGAATASTPQIAVTAGTTYVTRVPLRPSAATSGRTATLTLTWVGAAGTVSATVNISAETSYYTYNYPVVVATAPTGATACTLSLTVTGLAAAEYVNVDDVYFGVAGPAGNLLTYDEYSFETSLPPWTVDGASAERVFLDTSITDGYYALQLTPAGGGVIASSLDRLIPVEPGTTYAVGVRLVAANGTQENTEFTSRVRIDWYGPDGTLLAADNPDQFLTTTIGPGYYGHINGETRTCPAGAAYARAGVEIDQSHSLVTPYYLDNLTLLESHPAYTLTIHDDTASVSLLISDDTFWPDSPETVRLSVLRMEADGKGYPVRTYSGDYVQLPYDGQPILVEDYEAPIDQPIWYMAAGYTDAGVSTGAFLTTWTVQSPHMADADSIWVKSPGLPALNTRVMIEAPITWERAGRSTKLDIIGRVNPIGITERRAGGTASLSLLVWEASANAQFDALLDNGLPVLIQAAPGYGVTGNLYLLVDDITNAPLGADARQPGWRWTLAVAQTDRPAGGLQGSALRTWQDVLDSNASWFDVFTYFPTWLEVLTGAASQ